MTSLFHSAYQTTLAGRISCSGQGLHSGKTVRMTLYPAEADTGIQFVRLDEAEEKSVIAARYTQVTNTMLGTTLTNEYGVSVSTIEHLMAALWGMGVDNVIVALDAPEVPIMDGSSEPFVFLLECAGVKKLSQRRDTLEVIKNIRVTEGNSSISLTPFDGFRVDITIDYPGTVIPKQHAVYDFGTQDFKNALCRARTFGFASDVEKLQAKGLALGGSLNNAIVIGETAVINKEGLRFNDEFVRHKALDLVGDFFLSGLRMRGAVTAERPGHGINNKVLHALFADRCAWRLASSAAVSAPAFQPAAYRISA